MLFSGQKTSWQTLLIYARKQIPACRIYFDLVIVDELPEYLLVPSDFNPVQLGRLWKVQRVHFLGKPEQFSVELPFLAPLDLAGVRSTLTWMHTAHVPAKGLSGVEKLIAWLAVVSLDASLWVFGNHADVVLCVHSKSCLQLFCLAGTFAALGFLAFSDDLFLCLKRRSLASAGSRVLDLE